MISFKEYLEEGKQVGIVYHYTTLDSLRQILHMNTLKSAGYLDNKDAISVTRDKNFHKRIFATGVPTEIRITLDGNKLSHNYKIRPYHDLKYF